MKKMSCILNNEDGSMIVITLLLLAVLSIVGISAVNTSIIDREIVSNNVRYQGSFFAAESGAEIGIELMEQSNETKDDTTIPTDSSVSFNITSSNLYMNDSGGTAADTPSSTNYDANYLGLGSNQVYLKVYKDSVRSRTGTGSLEMVSGYDGKGKGSAGGGVANYYNIRTHAEVPNWSSSKVHLMWRHML